MRECCTNKKARGAHELLRSVYRLYAVARRTRGHVMFSERTHSKMAANAAIRFPTSRTTTPPHASVSFLFYCVLKFAIYVFFPDRLIDRISCRVCSLIHFTLIRGCAFTRYLSNIHKVVLRSFVVIPVDRGFEFSH